jgi:hypothetical protein
MMNVRKLSVWALSCALGAVGCGGDEPDRDRGGDSGEAGEESGGTAGTGGSTAGKGGVGGAGVSGGGGGGKAGSSGSAGASGTSTGGSAGTATSGSGGGGTAGSGGNPIPDPLPPADDPSRISELRDCVLAQAGTCVVTASRTKEEACDRFEEDWPKRAPTGYSLPDDDCVPAELDADAQEDAIRRINLYRWFSNQPALTANAEWAPYAQDCSAIQAHLDDVDHYPPATSACYTERGGAASAESLLAIGSYTPADSIDDLIWDWGDRNFHVLGHRWWLLHPGLASVGLGFTLPVEGRRGTCVRTNDGNPIDQAEDISGIVTYPGFGITPYELISRESHAKPVPDALEWSIVFPPGINLATVQVRAYRSMGGSYQPFEVGAGAFLRDFNGVWIQPNVDPAPPGEYVLLVSGTALGEFGYRLQIERCGGDEAPLACDTLDQDCDVAGFGCYGNGVGYCTRAGTAQNGAECDGNLPAECVAGAACVENHEERDAFACALYCDPTSTTAATSCNELCPAGYIYAQDPDTGEPISAHCQPGVGSSCDPLDPACPDGQACYGWEPARCFEEGTLADGQPCEFANDCAPGLLCIAAEGSALSCNPYCDIESTTAADSCEMLCPGSFFTFDGFGACYEP